MGRLFIPASQDITKPTATTAPSEAEKNERILQNMTSVHDYMRDAFDRTIEHQASMMRQFASTRGHTPLPPNPTRADLAAAIDREMRRCLVLERHALDWATLVGQSNQDLGQLFDRLSELPPEATTPTPLQQPPQS